MATTPKTMPTNVGGMERMLRIIAGIAILYIGMGYGYAAMGMDWHYPNSYWFTRMVSTLFTFWYQY